MNTEKNENSWLALAGISLASFLGCLDFTIVNTALPAIQENLNATVTDLQWVINIFMLTLSALMVIMGRVADNYGRRKILYSGMILFAASSVGAGMSPNIDSLIFFRFVQGISVAILYTVPIALIPSIFPSNLRGKATGILIGINGLGLAIGPVIGGLLVQAFSWRWIFFANPPIIVLSFIFCLKSLKESKAREQSSKMDWPGLVLLMISLPAIIFATIKAASWGWGSAKTISLYALSAFSLVGFYFAEKKTTSPIIQFKLFANRIFISGLIANFSLAFFYTVAFFLVPLYLHSMRLENSLQIGLMLLPASIMVVLLSPIVGHWVDRSGPKKSLILGFALFSISAILQACFTPHSSISIIFTALISFGIGWALILSPSIVAGLSSVPDRISGVAMGSLGTFHNFGGAIGLAVGTVIYHYQAKLSLLTASAQLHLQSGHWIEKAVNDPTLAVQIIHHSTAIKNTTANHLLQQFFMRGYSATMWLLVGVSVIALVTICLIKKPNLNN